MVALTDAEHLKFRILANGVTVTDTARAAMREWTAGAQLTPADYASTSGLILRLADDVWVNAPFSDFNPNFVERSPYCLDVVSGRLAVYGEGLESEASYWPPPMYHGSSDQHERPLNNYVFTHGDRVRLSPIQGCAMACKFCNIPYEDRYATKPVDAMLHAIQMALADPIQPSHHVLVSGGTPRLEHHEYLQDVYLQVLAAFPTVPIDIMMVPVPGLLDLKALAAAGVNELSINLEVFDQSRASALMRHKFRQGVESYLDFIEEASSIIGDGRIRSMLMVGLEPIEHTLAGITAIIDRGGVPVLSPFRPDPATPLRDTPPPSAAELLDVYLRATDLAGSRGVDLGPTCPPCTHNTLTLAQQGPSRTVTYPYTMPTLRS